MKYFVFWVSEGFTHSFFKVPPNKEGYRGQQHQQPGEDEDETNGTENILKKYNSAIIIKINLRPY